MVLPSSRLAQRLEHGVVSFEPTRQVIHPGAAIEGEAAEPRESGIQTGLAGAEQAGLLGDVHGLMITRQVLRVKSCQRARGPRRDPPQRPPATARGPSPSGSCSGVRPATISVTIRAVPNAIVHPMCP